MLRIQTRCSHSSTDIRTCGSVLYYRVLCRIDVAAFKMTRQNICGVAAFVVALDDMHERNDSNARTSRQISLAGRPAQ